MQPADLSFVAAVALLAGLAQCASGPPGDAVPKPSPMSRGVSLPTNLSGHEEQCLAELEDVLRNAGFSPMQRSGGAYQLDLHVAGRLGAAEPAPTAAATPGSTGELPAARGGLSFSVPGGPLQGVVSVTLRKGARIVATAEGRFEGARSQFTAEQVVQDALHRCLNAFSTRLQAVNEMKTARSGILDTGTDD